MIEAASTHPTLNLGGRFKNRRRWAWLKVFCCSTSLVCTAVGISSIAWCWRKLQRSSLLSHRLTGFSMQCVSASWKCFCLILWFFRAILVAQFCVFLLFWSWNGSRTLPVCLLDKVGVNFVLGFIGIASHRETDWFALVDQRPFVSEYDERIWLFWSVRLC